MVIDRGWCLKLNLKLIHEFTFIVQFIKRHKLEIPEELIEGTIHCKEGAAPALCERIYELLTNRKWVSARCVCVSAAQLLSACSEDAWSIFLKNVSRTFLKSFG